MRSVQERLRDVDNIAVGQRSVRFEAAKLIDNMISEKIEEDKFNKGKLAALTNMVQSLQDEKLAFKKERSDAWGVEPEKANALIEEISGLEAVKTKLLQQIVDIHLEFKK